MSEAEVLLRGLEITRRWGGLIALNKVSLALERRSMPASPARAAASRAARPLTLQRWASCQNIQGLGTRICAASRQFSNTLKLG